MSDTYSELDDGTDDVMLEVRKRYRRCVEFESVARARFIEDIKFSYGDSDNGYQWPGNVRRSREQGSRPCLTMNVTRQHNLQIINDAKQSPAVINIRPVGNGASKEAADIFHGVTRYIESNSKAAAAYSTGREFQVCGGIGWWRIVTDYANEDSFDQDIFIEPVNDPLSVYYDPAAKRKDKTDARFMFVFDEVPREEFGEAYPKLKGLVGTFPLGMGESYDGWLTRDTVRICEYFRKVMKKDQMISFIDENGERKQVRKSLFPANGLQELLGSPGTLVRDIFEETIEWKLIAGNRVVDETVWLGKYIPLVPVVGEEIIIDGIMDRKGHTRAMKDAQRMFNYNASAQVEFVALQTKSPWVGPAKAVEEYQGYWNNANRDNASFLPFNHVDDDGTPIPPPVRTDPPNASPAFESGMSTAFNQMMMVSGQWQNQMGMGGNERTGNAIERRQDQGDTATFHFRDNYEAALVTTGMMLVDLIPKIYDTKRVLLIQADDGTDLEIEINPAAKKAFEVQQLHDQQVVKRIFNPKVGKYSVIPQPGASYGTRREQTVRAMTLLLTQAPNLAGIIGDLMLSAMDFKEAQEAAIRLKRMVPPQALGQGPSEGEMLLQQQVAQLRNALEKALQQQGKDQLKLTARAELRNVNVYEAETKRIQALGDALGLDVEGVKQLVKQLVSDAAHTSMTPIIAANKDELEAETLQEHKIGGPQEAVEDDEAPVPGARKAPDGKWYLPDPTREGQYLLVTEREE